ncbi:MAG: DNA-binding protein [Proteobacteria bacterium]|nr:DNA-binding protein [Pseudomonadota bacterium]
MSRSSDTRQRTREAAAQLAADGKRPHDITVDLIYAAIQQGSRTTINDELKAWKDDKAKVDTLGADLPPAVADAMRSLWVTAAEHGGKLFAQQRSELEAELARATEQTAVASADRDAARVANDRLVQEGVSLRAHIADLQQQLAAESTARGEAQSQAQALHLELSGARKEAAQQLETLRVEHEQQARAFHDTIQQRDAAFRVELDTATQRLEAAQAHMLQQIDIAREGQRRAERELAKALQRQEQLQSETAELRMQHALQTRDLANQVATAERLSRDVGLAITERERLVTELASATGRLEATEASLRSAEGRAAAAEQRVRTAMGDRIADGASVKPSRGKRHQHDSVTAPNTSNRSDSA